MDNYRFDKRRHRHEYFVDGKWRSLTGCTTVLRVLNKPKLIQWAVDLALSQIGFIKNEEWKKNGEGFIKVKVPEKEREMEATKGLNLISTLSPRGFLELLDKIRVAHATKRNDSAKYGKKIHGEIEKIVLKAINENNGYVLESEKHKEPPVQNFIDWSLANKARFLAAERNIYSVKLFIGGILDILCEIDGEVWLMDIKTTDSGIYPENFAQMAGYELMLEEREPSLVIKGYIVLNLKKDGDMLEKRSVSNEENKKYFLACLEIYRQQERIKINILVK